ncbi:MAG: TonB-dependent receptor [Lunatimonas sp.]|uniref:SusC/RagA family TonB-linked outer membrane protein n=1 Tax=Lunatimonas sp. TaxID=2060141 RepID=UPI00263B975F|nr:TonB-dependent receptor [Lunatimonas sp.]MCC5938264.1 TonB-dependent receptor [Lunatimonas sp.]
MKKNILRQLLMLSKRLLYGFLIQVFFCTILLANTGNAQRKTLEEVKISVNLSEKSLSQFFKLVESKTDFRFTYSNSLVDLKKTVSVESNNGSLYDILVDVSKQTDLNFVQVNSNIHVRVDGDKNHRIEVVEQEYALIKGRVTDERGEPIPGATIVVEGTNIGAVTNINGEFSLEASEGSVLVISFIGYRSQRITVGNQSIINITLAEDQSSLEEVVVVGYGTQRKADITGSVSTLSEDLIQSRPLANFEDALQGRASGVQVRQTGGDLEGRFSINIRGVGSVTGSNDPLIVVDGVPLFSSDFSTINPKDIVSMDILKDASATAIYGARAANGVVIITTKKGKAGKTQFTLSTDIGFEEIFNRFDVMSTEEQRLLFVEAFRNSNRSIATYDDPSHPAWQVDTDWQDLGTRTALRQNYNLGFSGGTDNTQFSGSLSYLDRQGTIVNSDLKNWFLRLNLNTKINEKFSVSTNLTGSHQMQNTVPADDWNSSGYRSFIFEHSYTEPFDEAGNLTAINTVAAPYFGANANPLIDIMLPTRERNVTRLLGNVKFDFKPTNDLTVSANLGGDIVNGKGYTFLPVYQIGLFGRPEGQVTVPNRQELNWVTDLTANYVKRFNEHDVKLLGGFSAQQFIFENSSVTGAGTINNSLNQLANQINFNASGSRVSSGLVSTFLRANYSYSDKYLFTATVRRDGSSKFGPESRYGVFPSGSVAWRISEEEFIKNSKVIDDFKLRTSYGLTGNQEIGNFAFLTRATGTPYVFGNNLVVGNSPQNLGDPNLKWESTKQFDIGTDISLFEGRVYLTADYYNRTSQDLLIQTPVALTAGVTEDPTVNLGSVLNKGFEFSINSRNTVGKLGWSTNFNISFNRNEILDIGTNSIGESLEIPGQLIPLSNQPANLSRAGHPVGSFYMWQFDGVWQLGEEDAARAWAGAVPGDPKYKDLNGNGVFDAGDKTIVGNPHPRFFGGIDNSFDYKNFSLSVFFDFSGGFQVYNTARNLFARGVPFVQNLAEVNDFWTPENPSNAVPRPSQGGNTTTLVTMVSDRFLENGDFIRLKNLSLSYNFPSYLFNDKSVEALKLSLTGTNLIMFTNYTGLDPEASSRASLLSAGIDYTPYPQTRLVSLSAQIIF